MVDTPDIENAMLGLLARRVPDASICPSEVARALRDEGWRELMPCVRDVASRLAGEGVVRVTQGDHDVDVGRVSDAGGPIRLRRGRRFSNWPEPAHSRGGQRDGRAPEN